MRFVYLTGWKLEVQKPRHLLYDAEDHKGASVQQRKTLHYQMGSQRATGGVGSSSSFPKKGFYEASFRPSGATQ